MTIASAEIIRLIVRSVTFREMFGGSDGITGFADEFYALNPFAKGGRRSGPITSTNDPWITVVGAVVVHIAARRPRDALPRGSRPQGHP